MRPRRVLMVASVTIAATLGIPGASQAAPRIPRALQAAIAVPGAAPVGFFAPSGSSLSLGARLPYRVNMIGFTFSHPDAGAAGVSLAVRAHADAGWGEWQQMQVDPEESPDGPEAARGGRENATEPAWVGTADRLIIRIRVAPGAVVPSGLRLHVINTKGDARAPGLIARAWRAIAGVLGDGDTWTGAPASAATTAPGIITRAQWGADESLRQCGPDYASSAKMVFVHHTDGTNTYKPSDAPAIVRAIMRFHVKTRGWCDIGYNFLVDRYGQVFEGRYGGMTAPVIGGHVRGFNTGSVGVALMGDFTKSPPTRAQTAALTRLVAWRLDVVHVPPVGKVRMVSRGSDRYPDGAVVWMNRISGHRDGQRTACPGNKTYRLLPDIRARVERTGNPKVYLPSVPATLLRPDGDGAAESLSLAPRFSRAVDWSISILDSAGAVVRAASGSGTSAGMVWDATLDGGGPVPSGIYSWRIEARNAQGSALPATGTLAVVTLHPDGTLLADPSGRYLIEGGAARPVDDAAFASWFGGAGAVPTGPAERARYGAGAALPIREGALLGTADGARYVVSGGARRAFSRDPIDTFGALGENPAAVIEVAQEVIDALAAGRDVADATTHPPGQVARDADTLSEWLMTDANDDGIADGRRAVPGLALRSRYRTAEVVAATAADLLLPVDQQNPVAVRDGALLRLDDRTRWIVSAGERRWFAVARLFDVLGFEESTLLAATSDEVSGIPIGPTIG